MVYYRLLKYTGIPLFLREVIQQKKITIITFHDPSVITFQKTVEYLKKHYSIIPLSYLIDHLNNNKSFPSKSIIITMDDGHKGNYRLLKIINEYQVPVTIFLCSEIFNTNRHFWWLHQLNGYSIREIKQLTEIERRNYFNQNGFDFLADYGDENRQALNFKEVNEMLSTGLIDFQSHTMFHVLLNKCEDSMAFKEVKLSKINLEEKLSKKIYAIAYPNGCYTDREIINVKNSGYHCALTTEPGYNSINTNHFKLKRIGIKDNADINEIIVRTSGLWGFFKKVKNFFFPSID